MDGRGTGQVDNQGNPLPSVGGVCNLSEMHLTAQGIEIPDAGAVYGMGLASTQGLDWEFYQVNPQVSAGAQPASQNDFYGSLYSLSQAGLDNPFKKEAQVVVIPQRCDCNGAKSLKNAGTWENKMVTNKSFIGMAALWTLLIVVILGYGK